jgi:hypothetical protein
LPERASRFLKRSKSIEKSKKDMKEPQGKQKALKIAKNGPK